MSVSALLTVPDIAANTVRVFTMDLDGSMPIPGSIISPGSGDVGTPFPLGTRFEIGTVEVPPCPLPVDYLISATVIPPKESPDMSTKASELRDKARRRKYEAQVLLREAREIERAEEIASRPKMPAISMDGSRVVLFEKYQSGRSYSYAALGWRVGNMADASVRWVVTGNDGVVRHNWPSLLNFIGKSNWASIRSVTATSPLMAPEDVPPASELMGAFGRPFASKADDCEERPVFGDDPYYGHDH